MSEPHAPGTVLNPWCGDQAPRVQEAFFLTCCFVAGKNAVRQQAACQDFIQRAGRQARDMTTPLEILDSLWCRDHQPHPRCAGDVQTILQRHRIPLLLQETRAGQYTRLTYLIYRLLERRKQTPDFLRSASRDQLVELPGIGYKTASFFLLNTRKDLQVAVLDVHILRYLREHLHVEAPDSTPASTVQYRQLEDIWLQHCQALGRSSRDLDFEVWQRYSEHT